MIRRVEPHMYHQNKKVQVVDLNLVPYQEAWDMQERLMSDISGIKLANRDHPQNDLSITPNYLSIYSGLTVIDASNYQLNDHETIEKGKNYTSLQMTFNNQIAFNLTDYTNKINQSK